MITSTLLKTFMRFEVILHAICTCHVIHFVCKSELYQICLKLLRGKLCPSQDMKMSKLAQNRAIPIILDRIIHVFFL